MITIAWVFVIALHLPSFGGPVTIVVESTSQRACESLRRVAVGQLGGEENVRGTVSLCAERAQ